MNEILNFKMQYLYQDVDNWKEKESIIIINTIGGARIGETVKFHSYANLSFANEDTKNENAIVKCYDKYEKKGTNVLVFDIIADKYNEGKYDKLLIYHKNMKMKTYYGHILLNTKENTATQIADTYGDLNSLLIAVNHTIINIPSNIRTSEKLKTVREFDAKLAEYRTINRQNN